VNGKNIKVIGFCSLRSTMQC